MNKTTTTQLINLAAGVALGLAVSMPVIADDTEILIGSQLDPGSPNIMFVIDTSGSMASDVVIGDDYDPNRTYVGDCSLNRFYWNQEGTGTSLIPACDSGLHVNKDAFHCSAATSALNSAGRYRDSFVQYNTKLEPIEWRLLQRENEFTAPDAASRLTECLA
ncbi:MAG: hypothetical protein KJO35_07240, partial [Gammaproteobacteria bacterium]|nr:hypothetical protein [Gammaproteobacteria bacterium]